VRNAHNLSGNGGFLRIPRCFLACLLVSFASSAAVAAGPITSLEIHDFDSGAHVMTLALDEPSAWILEWRHSVTGILVHDYFAIREGRIVLEQSHMPSFDAGLGHIPGRGRLESDGNHGYWVRDINEPVPGNRFLLRVGDVGVNDHTLIIEDRRINLSELVPRQLVVMTIGEP